MQKKGNIDRELAGRWSTCNPWHSSNPHIIGGSLKTCPKCGSHYNTPSAVSRVDNKTKICPACGQREALEGYLKKNHKKGEL